VWTNKAIVLKSKPNMVAGTKGDTPEVGGRYLNFFSSSLGLGFRKKLPRGTVLTFSQRRQQLLVEVRHGAGTREDPCILGRVLDSAFMQASVRLSCNHSLILLDLELNCIRAHM